MILSAENYPKLKRISRCDVHRCSLEAPEEFGIIQVSDSVELSSLR